jgi:hypothetical protein
MTPAVWIFAGISIVILLLLFLFLYFCSGNIFTKSISTILVILGGLGGSKFTPAYNARFGLQHPLANFNGAIAVGGESTDSTILICVLGVTLIVLIGCVTFLKYSGKPL